MTTDTTPAAIEALLKDVTPGPWEWAEHHNGLYGHSDECVIGVADYEGLYICNHYDRSEPNARFIAAARDLVPALAADRDYWKAKAEAPSTGHTRTDTILSDPRVVALLEVVESLNAACDAMWNDHERIVENLSEFGPDYQLKEKHIKAISEAQQKLPSALAAFNVWEVG